MRSPSAVTTFMATAGFTLEMTGGNCTAYIRALPDGNTVWLTQQIEPVVPESFTDAVEFGMYDASGEAMGISDTAHNLFDAIITLNTLGWL